MLKHDYISSIWLRKLEPFHFVYTKSKHNFIPKRIHNSGFCYCGLQKGAEESKCLYCSSRAYFSVQY